MQSPYDPAPGVGIAQRLEERVQGDTAGRVIETLRWIKVQSLLAIHIGLPLGDLCNDTRVNKSVH